MSAKYNQTSLTQVLSEYFAGPTHGDVGGDDVNYVPERGYPGTLATGETFEQDHPMSSLPRRLLHPWPAFQVCRQKCGVLTQACPLHAS
jgi:hypothetical protein